MTNQYDIDFMNLVQEIIDEGEERNDRTGVGTTSLFGYQLGVDISEYFPLLTVKQTSFRLIKHELLWFLNLIPDEYKIGKYKYSNTNIKYLVDNNVNIWNEWPYVNYKKTNPESKYTLNEFINKIKESDEFAYKWGDLGNVYGKQWIDWGGKKKKNDFFRQFFMDPEVIENSYERGINQIEWAIDKIKNNPTDRGIIVNAWNVKDLPNMALRPCHTMFQFYVRKGEFLDIKLYQRSCDIFLGAPFNFASYALLCHMISKITNYKPGRLIITYGDVHLYKNHKKQAEEMLERIPKSPPSLILNGNPTSLRDFDTNSFEIVNYDPHPQIKAPIAV